MIFRMNNVNMLLNNFCKLQANWIKQQCTWNFGADKIIIAKMIIEFRSIKGSQKPRHNIGYILYPEFTYMLFKYGVHAVQIWCDSVHKFGSLGQNVILSEWSIFSVYGSESSWYCGKVELLSKVIASLNTVLYIKVQPLRSNPDDRQTNTQTDRQIDRQIEWSGKNIIPLFKGITMSLFVILFVSLFFMSLYYTC